MSFQIHASSCTGIAMEVNKRSDRVLVTCIVSRRKTAAQADKKKKKPELMVLLGISMSA